MRPMLWTVSLLILANAPQAQLLGLSPKLTGSRLGQSGDNGLGFENEVLVQPSGEVFVISAAPDADGAAGVGAGRVVIWGTDPRGEMGKIVWRRSGASAGSGLGFSVSVIGDQNGDGVEDFAISTPGCNDVAMYSGDASKGFPLLGTLSRPFAGGVFGGEIARLGDIDGDGREDFAITTLAILGSGLPSKVDIYSGTGFSVLRTITAPVLDDLFGISVTRIDDVDNNGVDDMVVGAPGTNAGAGAVHCYSSNGAKLWSFAGGAFEEFGASLLATVDPNNNMPIVFAGGASEFFGQRGAVRAIDGTTGQQLGSTLQGRVGARYGRSLAEADANADGLADLIIGAPGEDALYVNLAPTYSAWGFIKGTPGQPYGSQYSYGTDLATIPGAGGQPDTLVVGAPGATHPTLGGQTGKVDLRTFNPWSFQAQHHQISSATGGSVAFDVFFSPQNAGDFYVTLLTASGTSPGFQFAPGPHMYLNPDGLTFGALANPGVLLTNEIGVLQQGGVPQGPIQFQLPPLVGLTQQFHTVILVLDPVTGQIKFATEPVPIRME